MGDSSIFVFATPGPIIVQVLDEEPELLRQIAGISAKRLETIKSAWEEQKRIRDLSMFLQEHGLYVFTLNGFPYGPFHQQPVKALVHAPDWRDEERVARLASDFPGGMVR